MIKIKIGGLSSEYTKLSVFDFDGTLFKSPDKPPSYSGNWWISKDSLNPPYVPKIPDDSYWNMDIVLKAKQEINQPNTFCVLFTGRVDQFFEDRVKELLKQKKLNFKIIKLNTFGGDTAEFKITEINSILNKFKKIKNIELWDDEPEKIELYKEKFQKKVNFLSHLVGE